MGLRTNPNDRLWRLAEKSYVALADSPRKQAEMVDYYAGLFRVLERKGIPGVSEQAGKNANYLERLKREELRV